MDQSQLQVKLASFTKLPSLLHNRPLVSELACTYVLKRVFVQNNSSENEFDLPQNKSVSGTHFHMNGFVQRLVRSLRQNTTRKWSHCMNL